MDYGEILSRAWRIVWKNKFMLLIGFLAALGAGTNGNSANYSMGSEDAGFFDPQAVEMFFERYFGLLLVAGFLVIVIALLLWLLRLAAQAGLIDAADRLDRGETMTFGRAMSSGLNQLGRMVGVNLLIYGPLLLLGLFLGALGVAALVAYFVPVAVQSGPSAEDIPAPLVLLTICVLPLLCLMFLYWLVATLIYPFAQRGAVLADLGVGASVRHGWQVLRDNLGAVLILAVIFVAISFFLALISAAIAIPVAIAGFLPVANAIADGQLGAGEVILAAVAALLIGLVVATIHSVVVAWRSTTFTLAYRQFTKGVVPPPVA
jgi:hypothetical protein